MGYANVAPWVILFLLTCGGTRGATGCRRTGANHAYRGRPHRGVVAFSGRPWKSLGQRRPSAGGPSARRHLGSGREGFALALHSGYVMIPDDPSLRPEHGFTVEVWVKLNKSSGDLICKNSVYMIRLGGSMTGLIGVDGRWQTLHGRHPVPTGRWTHLAITYDAATKTGALYLDGALDGKQQFTSVTKGLVLQGRAELRLGLNDWNPLGSEVDGKVAALRISNVARTFEPLDAPAPKTVARGNLVPNGNFEMGLLGWRLAGEGDATLLWAPEEKDAARGRLCLRTLTGSDLRSSTSPEALLSRPIPAVPGARLHLDCSRPLRWPRAASDSCCDPRGRFWGRTSRSGRFPPICKAHHGVAAGDPCLHPSQRLDRGVALCPHRTAARRPFLDR